MNKHTVRMIVIFLLCCLFASLTSTSIYALKKESNDAMNERRKNALYGDSIQVDPTFPYYQGRSAESIAEEIKLAGYQTVHYFITNENNINGNLIEAFHKRNIAVWALVLGNGTYNVTNYPKEWPEWQMTLLTPQKSGYYLFSLNNKDYRKWKKKTLANLIVKYPFDGIEIAEPYFPEWDGIKRGVYGDVGTHASTAFQKKFNRGIPDFVNKKSKFYYLNDVKRYKLWQHFRVRSVNEFLDDIINGKGGIRQVRNDILIGTWSLAIQDGIHSVDRIREFHGLDASSMVRRIKPDIHFFQTHWPDWMLTNLPADYILNYHDFVKQVRLDNPLLPIGIQTDIGSTKNMLRTRSWLNDFKHQSNISGYQSWTAYEYHLGEYMYTETPKLMKAKKIDKETLLLSFNKRINLNIVKAEDFSIQLTNQLTKLKVESYTVDGNRLRVTCSNLPDQSFKIHVKNIQDTPNLWFIKGYKPNVMLTTIIEVE